MELKLQQIDALAYARSRDNIALFMEMRMGKTASAILWAKERGFKRVLLIAPLSILPGRLNWTGALQEFGITPTRLYGLDADARLAKASWYWSSAHGALTRHRAQGWFLINPQAINSDARVLDLPWDCVILDECTFIRNPKAAITKIMLNSTHHVPHKALLSGLPNPEDELDLVTQFIWLFGDFLGYRGTEGYWKFRHDNYQQGMSDYDWVPLRGVRKRMKDFLHSQAFVASRKQYNVGSTKVREQRTVAMNKAQQRALRKIERDFAYADTETKWAPVVHTWMQRVAGGHEPVEPHDLISDAKLRLLTELLTETYHRQPVVVWFRFNSEIDAALRWLRQHAPKRRVALAYGESTLDERARVQEMFQDGKLDTLLIQAQLGKFGWNLSRADVAIYYSNTYDFEVRSQSEDRIIHVTKTHPVTIIDLVTENTPDEDVVEATIDKRIDAQALLSRKLTMRVNAFTQQLRGGRNGRLF